jgi:hypothetical protein
VNRLAALCAIGLLGGCALTVDAAYKISGPRHRATTQAAELATGRVDTWREISFDAEGLVCRDVYSPWTRSASVTHAVVNPNGFKAATQTFTVLEAVVVGAAVIGHAIACSRETCTGSDRWAIPVTAAAFGVDIAWGTYRSFTIHNEIMKSSEVTWGGEQASEPLEGITEACPIGTDIVLADGAEQLSVRIDQRGRSAAIQLPTLALFIDAHASFAIAGDHINIDRKGVPAIVAAARTAAPPDTSPPPSAPPPHVPSTISFQLDVNLPIPVPLVRLPRDHR